jgi:hypothetical protein
VFQQQFNHSDTPRVRGRHERRHTGFVVKKVYVNLTLQQQLEPASMTASCKPQDFTFFTVRGHDLLLQQNGSLKPPAKDPDFNIDVIGRSGSRRGYPPAPTYREIA